MAEKGEHRAKERKSIITGYDLRLSMDPGGNSRQRDKGHELSGGDDLSRTALLVSFRVP